MYINSKKERLKRLKRRRKERCGTGFEDRNGRIRSGMSLFICGEGHMENESRYPSKGLLFPVERTVIVSIEKRTCGN